MTFKTVTQKQDVTAVDIQTMGDMSLAEYQEYLEHGLFTIDHHGILRSEPAGYPIATNKQQLAALESYLNGIKQKFE